MILCDSDIFAIYHFFTHDLRYQKTREFLEKDNNNQIATSIYNLLELAGILSSGGKAGLGEEILYRYLNAADIKILFPDIGYLSRDVFWEEYCSNVMEVIQRGIRYGDAKIIWIAELHEVSAIITYNTRHFQQKTSVPVMNPDEWNQLHP